MKKNLFSVLAILIAVILVAKISGWFLNYSEQTNRIINTLMFTIIGFYYIVNGLLLNLLKIKFTLLISGLFLIAMNFIPQNYKVSIIGIVCIIVPMLLVRYSKELKIKEN